MKFYKILWILLLLVPFSAYSDVACNIGSTLYPNYANYYNAWPAQVFYQTNPITIRTWDNDPNCGIRDNVIYPINGSSCAVQNGSGGFYGGILYNYNPSDNNCSLPLDDYIPFFTVFLSVFGAFSLRKGKLCNLLKL